jgi:hypothetical protein
LLLQRQQRQQQRGARQAAGVLLLLLLRVLLQLCGFLRVAVEWLRVHLFLHPHLLRWSRHLHDVKSKGRMVMRSLYQYLHKRAHNDTSGC